MEIVNRDTYYQAIKTKYFGASNVKGARVKATAAAGSITLGWDHALNVSDNHAAAALALVEKYGWDDIPSRALVRGGSPDGKGDTFVLVNTNDLRTDA
jgi:hypothetical protein